MPPLFTKGPTWVCWVWFADPLSVPYPVIRMELPLVLGIEVARSKPGPWTSAASWPVLLLEKVPKTAQSLPTPWPPLDCTELPSMGYWSLAGGWLRLPLEFDWGTLNWATWMLPVQCPAVT